MRTRKILSAAMLLALGALIGWLAATGGPSVPAIAQEKPGEKATAISGGPDYHASLAGARFELGNLSRDDTAALRDELTFQRATQLYLWALPSLNMYGMKGASEAKFGKGYNVLPIFKDRLNAKTLITTPNSDVIYALGYLDLKEDGPLVIEAPPGLQGILDDFRQRPLEMVGEFEGKKWSGDVGLPGPDKGKGGKYLILPPDFRGDVPKGDDYFVYKSKTYGVFIFWRGFFKDPKQLGEPVKVMEQTRIYPLGKKDTAKPMQFPNASGVAVNMLYPHDFTAFEMLDRYIQHESVDDADLEFRGMAAALGIVKGKPFNPDAKTKHILEQAAQTAWRMGQVETKRLPKYYPDRQWIQPLPTDSAHEFNYPSYIDIGWRTAVFTLAYSNSPAMFLNLPDTGAKYPFTLVDADGDLLDGGKSYKLHLPPNVPAKLFWSVTLYDPMTGVGLDNGQPFPSLNSMDKPAMNADNSCDIYFGPKSPGEGKNWIATVPGKGFFTMVRLYGPGKPFFDQTWKPDDVVRVK
jgi:hypothetical protein